MGRFDSTTALIRPVFTALRSSLYEIPDVFDASRMDNKVSFAKGFCVLYVFD
jgi:hypothetical protein